jgi:hypothetical protein
MCPCVEPLTSSTDLTSCNNYSSFYRPISHLHVYVPTYIWYNNHLPTIFKLPRFLLRYVTKAFVIVVEQFSLRSHNEKLYCLSLEQFQPTTGWCPRICEGHCASGKNSSFYTIKQLDEALLCKDRWWAGPSHADSRQKAQPPQLVINANCQRTALNPLCASSRYPKTWILNTHGLAN